MDLICCTETSQAQHVKEIKNTNKKKKKKNKNKNKNQNNNNSTITIRIRVHRVKTRCKFPVGKAQASKEPARSRHQCCPGNAAQVKSWTSALLPACRNCYQTRV